MGGVSGVEWTWTSPVLPNNRGMARDRHEKPAYDIWRYRLAVSPVYQSLQWLSRALCGANICFFSADHS